MRRLPLRSPPRVRGKGTQSVEVLTNARITPAYAGKGGRSGWCYWRSRDHPRVCGEKSAASIWAICARGSPPRMRGKDGVNDSAQAVTGITPACAGKSKAHERGPHRERDHPRVCGEKFSSPASLSTGLGSPPRMRGKEVDALGFSCGHGITPAYAGKRLLTSSILVFLRDHPRVCGEKSKPKPGKDRRMGSPPRMRGKDAFQ